MGETYAGVREGYDKTKDLCFDCGMSWWEMAAKYKGPR